MCVWFDVLHVSNFCWHTAAWLDIGFALVVSAFPLIQMIIHVEVVCCFQEIEQERAAMADYEKRIRAEGRAAAEKAVASAQPSELSMAFV